MWKSLMTPNPVNIVHTMLTGFGVINDFHIWLLYMTHDALKCSILCVPFASFMQNKRKSQMDRRKYIQHLIKMAGERGSSTSNGCCGCTL